MFKPFTIASIFALSCLLVAVKSHGITCHAIFESMGSSLENLLALARTKYEPSWDPIHRMNDWREIPAYELNSRQAKFKSALIESNFSAIPKENLGDFVLFVMRPANSGERSLARLVEAYKEASTRDVVLKRSEYELLDSLKSSDPSLQSEAIFKMLMSDPDLTVVMKSTLASLAVKLAQSNAAEPIPWFYRSEITKFKAGNNLVPKLEYRSAAIEKIAELRDSLIRKYKMESRESTREGLTRLFGPGSRSKEDTSITQLRVLVAEYYHFKLPPDHFMIAKAIYNIFESAGISPVLALQFFSNNKPEVR